VLDALGIQYMVSGAVASSLQGEPRATHDIDLVVELDMAMAKRLVEAFHPSDFYLDQAAVEDAIGKRGMFNLIQVGTGDKVDFWMLTDTPFDRSRFARRYAEEFMGARVFVSSPEDTILVKLWWAKLSGGSEKQFTDALRVYEVQFEKLDHEYLRRWAEELSVAPMLARIQAEAETV